MELKERRSIGWGSLSLVLFLTGAIFTYLNVNKRLIGEHILEYLHLSILEISIAMVILIAAVILGSIFSKHLFAKLGYGLSTILLVGLAVSLALALADVVLGS